MATQLFVSPGLRYRPNDGQPFGGTVRSDAILGGDNNLMWSVRIPERPSPFTGWSVHCDSAGLYYVPKVSMRAEVMQDLRNVFNAANRHQADQLLSQLVTKYSKSAPNLSVWMEANIPEGLTVFELPPSHRRRLRTTNMLERLNQEIKRRTRVATLFPNEASLLRLVSAVLNEVSDDWETGKIYLTIKPDAPANGTQRKASGGRGGGNEPPVRRKA